MSRYVENMNRHVHSRHMVEQDMDWLKEFRDDPDYPGPDAEPLRAWRSRDYQAMLYIDRDSGMKRLAITRVQIDRYTGEYREGISWDALQQIKNETMGEDCWAVECYPPQRYVQNVANMRYLWILDNEPRFGWKQPTGHAPEPGHDNDDNEQPSHHGGIQQIIIGGES